MGILGVLFRAASTITADEWVIEYGGKCWDGRRFVKGRAAGMAFDSKGAAWNYVDATFPDDIGEDCSLYNRK